MNREASTAGIMGKIELKQIRLISSESRLSLRAGPQPGETKIEMNFELGVTPDERALKANVSCEAVSCYAERGDPAVLIRCVYQAIYKWNESVELTREEIEEVHKSLSVAAMLQTYPYIRHYVRFLSMEMGLPPLTIPMFRPSEQGGVLERGR